MEGSDALDIIVSSTDPLAPWFLWYSASEPPAAAEDNENDEYDAEMPPGFRTGTSTEPVELLRVDCLVLGESDRLEGGLSSRVFLGGDGELVCLMLGVETTLMRGGLGDPFEPDDEEDEDEDEIEVGARSRVTELTVVEEKRPCDPNDDDDPDDPKIVDLDFDLPDSVVQHTSKHQTSFQSETIKTKTNERRRKKKKRRTRSGFDDGLREGEFTVFEVLDTFTFEVVVDVGIEQIEPFSFLWVGVEPDRQDHLHIIPHQLESIPHPFFNHHHHHQITKSSSQFFFCLFD